MRDIPDVSPPFFAVLAVLGVCLAMLLFWELGRRVGVSYLEGERQGTSSAAAGAAVFTLMGLLIAFTFSGAGQRFDSRRMLMVEEANNIGTAWLRLDLLPANAQPALRGLFREYVETRLAVYRKLPDVEAAKGELAKAAALQKVIWTQAAAACRDSGSLSATILVLPALNQMIDVTTTRTMTSYLHPPLAVYAMLLLLALASALLVGYDMATATSRNWFLVAIFVVVNAFAIYIVADFELPRLGLIQEHDFDQVLMDLLQSMK